MFDPDDMPKWLAGFLRDKPPGTIAAVNEDDCAVMKWSERLLIVSTDFLNANPIAVQLGIGDLSDLGRLVVAANISDLCGSGAKPHSLLLGVTLPHDATEKDYKSVVSGARIEARKYGVSIVGGDSKLGNARSLFAVAIGSASSEKELFLKNNARPGDIVWTSGNLGSTAAAVWGFGKTSLPAKWQVWARRALLRPLVPIQKSQAISRFRLGRGGTDISDGLGADLNDICEASDVGVDLHIHSIPTAPQVDACAKVAGVAPWTFAFASGGDFQFLVTTRNNARERMNRIGMIEIGRVTKGPRRIVSSRKMAAALPIKGHRDQRKMSFYQEIDFLINEVNSLNLQKE